MSGILYVSNLKGMSAVESDDITKLFTARVPIRNLEKYDLVHVQQLSPSSGLLYRYKEEKIDWRKYVLEFRKEMLKMQKSIDRIDELLSDGKDVMLVCYCSSKKCHNVLLSDYIKELGHKVKFAVK